MICLIDADIIGYRCSAVTESEPEVTALYQVDEMMKRILHNTEATRYKAFLTGPGNFRYNINPQYKANRKDKPKPQHLKACQQFIVDNWNGVWCEGIEADDALGIEQDKIQKEEGYNTTIATIDKDLLMIPGYHYNFVKEEMQEVDYLQGIKHFYKQMLIGDAADNIKGVDKIGPVKAAKLIDHLETEEEMYLAVCELYKDTERFDMNADCLWIFRNEGETFTKRGVSF